MDQQDIEIAFAVLITVGAMVASIGAIWHWNKYIRRIPLDKIGLDETMRQVLQSQPNGRTILARGWVTHHEWLSLLRGHIAAIEAELKRRGVSPDDAQYRR